LPICRSKHKPSKHKRKQSSHESSLRPSPTHIARRMKTASPWMMLILFFVFPESTVCAQATNLTCAKATSSRICEENLEESSASLNLLQTKMTVHKGNKETGLPEFAVGITQGTTCKDGAPARLSTYVKDMCCPEGYEEVKTSADCQKAVASGAIKPPLGDWPGTKLTWGWMGNVVADGIPKEVQDARNIASGHPNNYHDDFLGKRPRGCIAVRRNNAAVQRNHGGDFETISIHFNSKGGVVKYGKQMGKDKVICKKKEGYTGEEKKNNDKKEKPADPEDWSQAKGKVKRAYDAGVEAGFKEGYATSEAEYEEEEYDDDDDDDDGDDDDDDDDDDDEEDGATRKGRR